MYHGDCHYKYNVFNSNRYNIRGSHYKYNVFNNNRYNIR